MSRAIVDPLIVGTEFETEVWASEDVVRAIDELPEGSKERSVVLGKLVYYARAGFRKHEGKGCPIRNEGDGVFRIGLWADLFRIIGFYTSDRRDEFIAISAFTKRGQKLVKQERKKIKIVARIKQDGSWRKRDEIHN